MIYEVTLHRVVEHETVYMVDADDPEEAEDMVLRGDYDDIVEDSEEGEMEDPEVIDVVEQVKENMQDVIVRTLDDFGKPCTYVTVRMKNGFTLRESTTCVDPANYNEEIGKEICLRKIEDKVWFLLGYQLQEDLFRSGVL